MEKQGRKAGQQKNTPKKTLRALILKALTEYTTKQYILLLLYVSWQDKGATKPPPIISKLQFDYIAIQRQSKTASQIPAKYTPIPSRYQIKPFQKQRIPLWFCAMSDHIQTAFCHSTIFQRRRGDPFKCPLYIA